MTTSLNILTHTQPPQINPNYSTYNTSEKPPSILQPPGQRCGFQSNAVQSYLLHFVIHNSKNMSQKQACGEFVSHKIIFKSSLNSEAIGFLTSSENQGSPYRTTTQLV